MKRNRMAAIGLLIATTCTSRTSMAVGDNLVANGTFDTDVSGWTTTNDTPGTWSPDDADGSLDSGSAVLGTLPHAPSGDRLLSVCVPVVGGSDYVLGAVGTFVSGSDVTRLHVGITWWGSGGCPDLDTSLASETIGSSAARAWAPITGLVTAPVDATSADVFLHVRTDTDGPVEAHFDDVVFAPVVCGEHCGDPLQVPTERSAGSAALVTASDALYVLEGAVGEQTCTPCICDVNNSGAVTALDALLTLDASVGGPVSLTCPP